MEYTATSTQSITGVNSIIAVVVVVVVVVVG